MFPWLLSAALRRPRRKFSRRPLSLPRFMQFSVVKQFRAKLSAIPSMESRGNPSVELIQGSQPRKAETISELDKRTFWEFPSYGEIRVSN